MSVDRIKLIALYKNRIKLYNEDAFLLIKKLHKELPPKTLFYLDPPYYNKGKDLYINFYEYNDHKNIFMLLKNLKKRYWVISYDDVPPIKKLYSNYRQKIYSLNYSAGISSVGSEVIVFSENLITPEDFVKPTNRDEIQHYSRLTNF